MNILFSVILLATSLSSFALASSVGASATIQAPQRTQADYQTISGVLRVGEENPLADRKRRSSEKPYESSALTGPTGLNALMARTKSLPAQEEESPSVLSTKNS